MAGDADLSMQVKQKNSNETVVHLDYILKLVEGMSLLSSREMRAVLSNLVAIVYLVGAFI
jgi:hypothetical protein